MERAGALLGMSPPPPDELDDEELDDDELDDDEELDDEELDDDELEDDEDEELSGCCCPPQPTKTSAVIKPTHLSTDQSKKYLEIKLFISFACFD